MSSDGLMVCADFSEQLEAWLDVELTDSQGEALTRHADGCAACQSELSAARAIASGLRSLPELECPAGVVAAVQRKIGEVRWDRLSDEGARDSVHEAPSEARWWGRAIRGSGSALLKAAALLAIVGMAAVLSLLLLDSRTPDEATLSAGVSAADRESRLPHTDVSGTYTAEELEHAELELRVALAYFGSLTQRAGVVLRDEVLAERVFAPPLRAFSRIEHTPR